MATPTLQVFSDTFNRATTPTGATTGSFGPPNSSWGVGNGWYDNVGSTGAVPGTGWNIVSGKASCTTLNKFAFLMQDPALTATPNQKIVVTFPSILTANNSTYFAFVRGTYNTDCYAAVMICTGTTSFNISKVTGGSQTTTVLTTGAVTYTAGHTYSVSLQATGAGATTTSLTAVLTDVTSSTIVSTLNTTDASSIELQSGGRVGLGVYNTVTQSMTASAVQIYSDTAVPYTPQYIGFLGDSLTYGLSSTLQTVPDLFCRILNSLSLTQHYVPINMGFSGATAANWLPGAGTGYMAAFIQNMNALGCKTVVITLGSNDAIAGVTAATFQANLTSIIQYLQAQIPGVQIMVNQPPYFDWVRFQFAFNNGSTAAALPLLRTYPYATVAASTGTATSPVVLGDTAGNTTFQYLNYQGLTDGGHPSDQGVPELMFLWLFAYIRNFNIVGSPVVVPPTYTNEY
jgi:lysophospholipase L1-like esterase